MKLKQIETILGIILVIIILKYFFMPDLLNWIVGYGLYNADCTMNIQNMEPMTIGGQVIDDFCNTARFMALVAMVLDIVLMILVFAVYKYRKAEK